MSRIIQVLSGRLPVKTSLLNVYAVIVALVFNWTLLASFWKLPSWLFYLDLGQVASIYAYSIVFDFIESVLLLAGFVLLSLALPAAWWREKFVSRSAMLSMVVMASVILSAFRFRDPDAYQQFVAVNWIWWLVTIGIALPLVWLAGRVRWLGQALETVADRCVIFLFIYMPLTFLSIVVVLVRIVF
jgi:hypothetical protein